MRVARLPDNEVKRLEALRSYTVLDGPKEAAIDALVRVAARVCDVPIAVVTLIDSARQCFLSIIGLDVEETPREVAFCTHAILQPSDILEVADTLLDERFSENPLVTGEPRIRFYAGAPLVDAEGYALGTLCVIDRQPRQLTSAQREVLRELSGAVMKLIEARRTETVHRETERQNALLRIAEEMADLGHFRIDVGGDNPAQPSHALWSQLVLRVLGWHHRTPLRIADFLSVLHPSDRPRVADAFQAALQRGVAFDVEARVLCAERELRYVHLKARCELEAEVGSRGACGAGPATATVIKHPHDNRVRAVFGMLQDITERTLLRERALHRSRLLATGTLAAGVGHEINNPLTYVVGNINLARERVQRASLPAHSVQDILTMLQDASEGASRIRDIVRGLKTFARNEEALCPTDVHSALNTALAMAMHELRHRATVHNHWDRVPPVLANEARLSQIFVNLLVNAAQSFSGSDLTVNEVRIRVHVDPAQSDRVLIEIGDNGPGIPAELQPRIFEPFFTTKPLGEGTGLGLSISHSLVTSLHGDISYTSEPGRGTTFRVSLPIAEQPAAVSDAPPRHTPVPPAPRANVLVIDDEPAIARSLQLVLGEQHSVTVFTDPRAAIALLEQEPERFDVIFCDLMMPFMTGMELYRHCVARWPALDERFVFMTGAAVDRVVESFLRSVPHPTLEKPFSFEPLSKLVEQRLRAARRGARA